MDTTVTVSPETTELTWSRLRAMRLVGRPELEVDRDRLPPGPRLPAVVQTLAMLRFRQRFIPWLHRRYGDAFRMRVIPGAWMILFSRPEETKEIFAGDPASFHAGKGNALLGPMMGKHSVLLQDEMDHRRSRKLLMPAFGATALRGYAGLVTEVTRLELAGWQPGRTFRSLERMNALTLEVILRVVFGVTDERLLTLLRPRVVKVVEISPAMLASFSYPLLLRTPPVRRTVRAMAELDQLLLDLIRQRRTDPNRGTRTDVLSRLIDVEVDGDRLDDAELRDQLITLLLAGHETTASSLAWTLYELGRNPGLQQRAARAAREGDDDYLQAVLKESMRLHPILPMVLRTLMEPARIGGYDLPAGVTIGPSILIAHSRSDNYPDPTAFDPERFLGKSPAPNTWIPFGGGARRCLGAGFALMEGTLVLRELLSVYRVDTVGSDRTMVRNITSVPGRGARIRVTTAG